MIGHPYERDFKSMASNNMIQNFHITAYDVTNDHTMLSPKLSGTRDKTVQQKPDRVVMDYVSEPKDVPKIHKFITILADVMFVNGAPFLITIPHGIKFVMVEHIPTCTAKQLSKSSKRVMKILSRSGMIVQTFLMDTNFFQIIDKMMEMSL